MRVPIIAFLILAACAAPDLGLPEDGVARHAWPRLVSLTEALGPTERPSRIALGTGAALEARADRLRARAAALRPSALTEAERGRIRDALGRLRTP